MFELSVCSLRHAAAAHDICHKDALTRNHANRTMTMCVKQRFHDGLPDDSARTMIRTLQDIDCEAFVALRREALLGSPLAFASSPSDDRAATVEAVRDRIHNSPDQPIFGAFRPSLVGIVGLYRDAHFKSSHKMYIWGMYVAPEHRRQGVGSQLMQVALEHVRRLADVSWVHLSVSSAAPEAERLYERMGFERWGTEPAALQYDGQTVDEHHLALRLKW